MVKKCIKVFKIKERLFLTLLKFKNIITGRKQFLSIICLFYYFLLYGFQFYPVLSNFVSIISIYLLGF